MQCAHAHQVFHNRWLWMILLWCGLLLFVWKLNTNKAQRSHILYGDARWLYFSDSVWPAHYIHGFCEWIQLYVYVCILWSWRCGGPLHVVIQKLIRSIKWVECLSRCLDLPSYAICIRTACTLHCTYEYRYVYVELLWILSIRI